jgi:uncharacterized protein with PQ loop repeat
MSPELLSMIAQIMGPLGATLLSAMFLSGFGVARDIIKKKSVGEYSPFPYVVQIMTCSMWVIYAIAIYHTGDMFWIVVCNSVGLVVASTIYSIYLGYSSLELRMKWLPSAVPFLMIALIGCRILWTMDSQLITFLGHSLLLVNTVMYAGPLAGIRRALHTKSTEFLPLSLGCTTFVCSITFLCFGLAIQNFVIWFPNVVGVTCGAVQISVWVYVSRSPATSTRTPAISTSTPTPVMLAGKEVLDQLEAAVPNAAGVDESPGRRRRRDPRMSHV